MKTEYRKLGEYIRLVDVRNTDLKVNHLLGVSVEKCFIESIANTIGTDFSKYKIVKKRQFTYIPDTSRRGDKIGIALLTDYDEGLVSNIYTVFEVIDTSKLLPEYLMLWFSRPEFDRYARYKSHGSVREIFDWDEMCRVELPIPAIEKQQKIMDAYNAITKRIQIKQKINENLEKTAQCLFDELKKNKASNEKLGNIAEINSGKRPDDISEGLIPLVGAGDVMGYINNYNYDGKTLVIGRVGTHGKVQRFNGKCWCSDNTLTIKSNFFEYTYFILKNIDYSLLNRGSTQPLITQTDMKDFDIYFDSEIVHDFEKKANKFMLKYDENKKEVSKLQNLKQLIISRISGM